MTPTPNDKKMKTYTIENAVRDICLISVAPASKSAVRKILEKFEQAAQTKALEDARWSKR